MEKKASKINKRVEYSPANRNIVIIGVGNEYREDDGAGIFVTRLLKNRQLNNCIIYSNQGETLSLLDQWTGAALAIVIDAIQANAKAGTILTIDSFSNVSADTWDGFSSHSFDIPKVYSLAHELQRLPSDLRLIGIVGQKFGYGQQLSPEVESACYRVAEEIARVVTDYPLTATGEQRVSR